MNLARPALILLFFIICNVTIGQTLKITAIGAADNTTSKLLQKQLVGKKMQLQFYSDSVSVSVVPLHKQEKMKLVGVNTYMRNDSTDTNRSSSVLTLYKTQEDQLSSVRLKLIDIGQAGDKMEIWIFAKPEQ